MEFKKLKQTIEINGKPIEAEVTIRVSEDELESVEGSFDFDSAEENEKYLNRFKSGELFVAVVSVTAEALGLEGLDILCGCHIHSNNLFDSKPFDSDVNETVSFHGMIDTALEDLKKQITEQANRLAPYKTERPLSQALSLIMRGDK